MDAIDRHTSLTGVVGVIGRQVRRMGHRAAGKFEWGVPGGCSARQLMRI